LIESLLFDGGYPLLERHLRRLAQSAQELGFRLNPQSLKEDLLARAATLQGRHKVRVMLEKSGEHRIECMSIESADDQPKRIIISSEAVHSKSWSLRHKLSQRTRYQKAHEFYSRLGYYDVVFFNEDNEITEGSFNNIFIRKGERWYTPPIECGLLPGVQRQWLLDSVQVDATEKRLVVDDLYRADEIFLTNAVRGVVKVELATTPNETSCSA
jgi:branched-subunit amino acid aminotransferase/4-amino-4-deoxychorismate lyase